MTEETAETGESVTLTHYSIEGRGRYRSRAEAAAVLRDTESTAILEHSHIYHVGDEVEVFAYRGWRPGKVVRLKRRRVVVHFKRNQKDQIAARSFYGAEVRPQGEGLWVQI